MHYLFAEKGPVGTLFKLLQVLKFEHLRTKKSTLRAIDTNCIRLYHVYRIQNKVLRIENSCNGEIKNQYKVIGGVKCLSNGKVLNQEYGKRISM